MGSLDLPKELQGSAPILTNREISVCCRGGGAGMLRGGIGSPVQRDSRVYPPHSHACLPLQGRINRSQGGHSTAKPPCLSLGRGWVWLYIPQDPNSCFPDFPPRPGDVPNLHIWVKVFSGKLWIGEWHQTGVQKPHWGVPVPSLCPWRWQGGREAGKPIPCALIPQP